MKSFSSLRPVAIMLLLSVALWALAATAANAASDASAKVEAAVRHAETYYQLGSTGQGDLSALQSGERSLASAEKQLRDMPESEAEPFEHRIAALRKCFVEQTATLRDTLDGLFPLTRFLTSPLDDSGLLATYGLMSDPAATAAASAAEKLAARLSEGEKDRRQPQLPAVVVIVPQGPALEPQSLRAFRASPRFQVYTRAEVEARLAPAEMADFLAGQIQPAAKTRLLEQLETTKLIVVTIRQMDRTDENVFHYAADARVFDAAGDSPVSPTQGFCRDRRDRLFWIAGVNLALFALALATYAIAVRRGNVDIPWKGLLAAPAAGFVVGRCLPYAIAPLLAPMRVPPGTPALASFWFPCLAGIVLIAGPLAAYWLACPWLVKQSPVFGFRNRGGVTFAAVGAGVAAFLAGPLLLCLENNLLIDVALTTASVMVLAFLAGRMLDDADPLPLPLVAVPLLLTMPAGVAVFHAGTIWLAIVAGAIVAIAATVLVLHSSRCRPQRPEVRCPMSDLRPPTSDLRPPTSDLRPPTPDYQPFEAFDRAWARLSDFLQGRGCHLGLSGPRGAGKSATAAAAIDRVAQELAGKGSQLVRLCGACPQPVGEPMAYAPFRQALAQHFEVNMLAPPGPKMQQISEALGGLFGSVIPFGRVLFPYSSGDVDLAVSPEEIHASIAWMLRRLCKTQPVLLFIDDAQWLDDASTRLLKHLLKEFPAGGQRPEAGGQRPEVADRRGRTGPTSDLRPPTAAVAIVLAANDKSCLVNLGLDAARHVIEVAYPTAQEQVQILVRGIGIQPSVAEEILARIGPATEDNGGLLWPLQLARSLACAGALASTAEGFGWSARGWPADFQVPAHIQAAIRQQWQSAAPYRTVLECAACGCEGREFRASLLAKALGKPYLDVLVILDEIERTSGLIHDVRDRDDVYAFHSSFLLEVIRGQLGIRGHGPRATSVPQIIREYHARLAAALETAEETVAGAVHEIANHFYAAGPRHAAQGVERCLQAAKVSAAGYDFRRAKSYLEMAAECAECAAAAPAVETARQIIFCQESQVTCQGEPRMQAADTQVDYLRQHPDAPVDLVFAVAHLCYEVGHRGHDPQWCNEAIRLCQPILAQPASPLEEAQARHLVALSQPTDRRAERIAELRTAYALVEHPAAADQETWRCLAQVVNSLAKELAKGAAEEQSEARRLFEYRLRLDEEQHLNDLRGVAVAVAGLGRLELYNEPTDIAGAEARFLRNLEISEAIGDLVGQVKMHSLLGACAWETGRTSEAEEHYRKSLDLAADQVDECFAAVGLMRCCLKQDRRDQFEVTAKRLLDLARRVPMPPECEAQLQSALEAIPPQSQSDTTTAVLRALRQSAGGSA